MTDKKPTDYLVESLLRDACPQGHPDFISKTLEELRLHSQKNSDYAHGGDPLGNFKRVAEILDLWGLHVKPYQVALIYMLKQVDAAGRMLTLGYKGNAEGLADKLQDISVYAKLISILYEEAHLPKGPEEQLPLPGWGGIPDGNTPTQINPNTWVQYALDKCKK